MRSKKNVQKIIPFITDRLSDIHKDRKAHILAVRPKMYAQNPCCAYIFCSIIIETRPTEDTTAERYNKLVNRYIHLRFNDKFLNVPKNEERWQFISENAE